MCKCQSVCLGEICYLHVYFMEIMCTGVQIINFVVVCRKCLSCNSVLNYKTELQDLQNYRKIFRFFHWNNWSPFKTNKNTRFIFLSNSIMQRVQTQVSNGTHSNTLAKIYEHKTIFYRKKCSCMYIYLREREAVCFIIGNAEHSCGLYGNFYFKASAEVKLSVACWPWVVQSPWPQVLQYPRTENSLNCSSINSYILRKIFI